ncbi:unnamed protein product [Chilo suppressalis]|uniref:Odorant receptor n=1 Tax=Chilo suppressalis TaxID=168631 RepID=A0ABN8AX01_CHISP|nr:unnamed protein product [Chilo suppressalis]
MKDIFILKTYCQYIYRVGSGNFWYEERIVGNDRSLSYKIYRGLHFFLYGCLTILEIMAAIFGVFPSDEKRDAVTFAVSHTIVMIKLFSVISNKALIKQLNKNMTELCEEHEEQQLMAEKYKIVKINVAVYFIIVYVTAVFFAFEGLRKLFNGVHFVTVVTYYPAYEDNSALANSFRIFTTIILQVMLMSMIVTVDTFTMTYLIIFKYKFITLRHYFDSLRENYLKMSKNGNQEIAAEQLTNGFVKGIIMHQKLLKTAKNIDTAFGLVIALQLCQSSGSAVSLMLQLALTDQLTFLASIKAILFVLALFFLLGMFLCNAGEITYQASLLADAIFYIGWHEFAPQPPPKRSLRRLVLLAIAQAQQPLIMKSFKMIELTYGTFLQVVRGTYSVFALFYAQNK